MPRISLCERSLTYKIPCALADAPFPIVLLPCLSQTTLLSRKRASSGGISHYRVQLPAASEIERCFFSALSRAGSCRSQRYRQSSKIFFREKTSGASCQHPQRRLFSACREMKSRSEPGLVEPVTNSKRPESASGSDLKSFPSNLKREDWRRTGVSQEDSFFRPFYEELDHRTDPAKQEPSPASKDVKKRKAKLQWELNVLESNRGGSEADRAAYEELQHLSDAETSEGESIKADGEQTAESTEEELIEQIQYLKTVRELETKLEKARHKLHLSMKRRKVIQEGSYLKEDAHMDEAQGKMTKSAEVKLMAAPEALVELKKEDFLGLVDLYFYSHRTRFLSESPDSSPTPLQLDDYSFKISEDFRPPTSVDSDLVRDEEGTPVSPLYHVEAEFKTRKMHEIKSLQRFVDLLLDDYSPLRDLFSAYKALPQPGVSYLSGGVTRLFLQRMSTPWRKSEAAMLRYLSLIDDMQLAGLPITPWEWSSAIYLAGQSFSNISNTDVSAAFNVWRQMEKIADVAARDVTFNILFDVAVKSNKFVLAEEVLREMHDRGFRLNRLGRVSLIYYYGKKGDGDGVRKAYRDFVEAGEIVDTLVLNCVMASLVNAQEPAAAEQIYERMKGLQERLRKDSTIDGEKALFLKYPPPGPDKIGTEMAANALGRVLLNASRLKTVLPEHHAELQNVMPLTPDAITYRILMSYHAKTSGNVDRLTVLLDDMTRRFQIPVAPLTFQILFKGFAIHGGSNRSDAKWTAERLQIAWAACVVCLKGSRTKNISKGQKTTRSDHLDLPSVEDAEAMAADNEMRANKDASGRPKPRRPTAWVTFIKQFATPYPETKPFDLYSTSRDAPESQTEDENGTGEEYRMPRVDLAPSHTSAKDAIEMLRMQPGKAFAVWAIRAFTRCTTDRSKVEDVWYQLGLIWRPFDAGEKALAIRELHRALKYCDTHGVMR